MSAILLASSFDWNFQLGNGSKTDKRNDSI